MRRGGGQRRSERFSGGGGGIGEQRRRARRGGDNSAGRRNRKRRKTKRRSDRSSREIKGTRRRRTREYEVRDGHVRRNGGLTRVDEGEEVVDGVEVWREQGVGARNEEIGNRKNNRMRSMRIGNQGLRVVGRRRGWTGRTERG